MQVRLVSRIECQLPGRVPLLLMIAFLAGLSGSMKSFAGSLSVEHTPPAKPQAAVLDKNILKMIQATTFEVVVKKPVHDSLKYEKPLPMDLIPFAIRNDKFLSVGTAFAIAPDQFVTAAHVLTLASDSQMKGFSLRDSSGKVYPIDKILKFSSRRDFVVFTIKGEINKQFIPVNTSPKLNEKVYAVGNAFGQGVVIRDGLYTSNTPEERDGAWKWIRFSAAASPGNSGGPLLDGDGKLIGIVQRKSENENLNYALPIAEVLNAKDHLAVIDNKVMYRIDNIPMTKITDYRHEVVLPKTYDELNQELIQLIYKDNKNLLAALFAENRKKIFPNGSGSQRLLYNSAYSTFFPAMVAMGSDGVWDTYTPKNTEKAALGDNGYLTTGKLGQSKYFHLRLPDNVAMKDVVGDSRKFMDLFLKGAGYTRTIGNEDTRVVSMGKAQEDKEFIDAYGRKWSVKTWPIEFADEKLMMMVLPVPDGFVGYLRITDTGESEGHMLDMKTLADFTYVSYYGTLPQWRSFLSIKNILPAVFAGIHIDYKPGHEFRYRSSRLAFSYPSSLMKISNDSDLQLGFTYFRDAGKVVWDVSKIVVGEDKSNNDSYVIVRENKPPRDIGDDYLQYWDTLAKKRYPYDHTRYFDDGRTIIATVLAKGGRVQSSDKVLYSVTHLVDGVTRQKAVASQLDSFVRGLKVN